MGSFYHPRKSIFPDSLPLFDSHVKNGRGDNQSPATGLAVERPLASRRVKASPGETRAHSLASKPAPG
jgi:hypothetical protein